MMRSKERVLDHGYELAHWTLVLLAWLCLGEQGMRLGWSLAAGVLAVALWWTIRIACRGRTWVLQARPVVLLAFGLLTATGVGLVQGQDHSLLAYVDLLLLAAVWGVWTALIETRSQVSTFELSPVAWHPLLAAVLALGLCLGPHSTALADYATAFLPFVLMLFAVIVYVSERQNRRRANLCRSTLTDTFRLLPPAAMGLMMGTLWMGNSWCAGLGWSNQEMVALHIGLMACTPAVVAGLIRKFPAVETMQNFQCMTSLLLLAMGALMLLGSDPIHKLLAMLFPSLAWAVHCCRKRSGLEWVVGVKSSGVRMLALLLGPVTLVMVAWLSPLLGPLALQIAMFWFGFLAFLQFAWMTRLTMLAKTAAS